MRGESTELEGGLSHITETDRGQAAMHMPGRSGDSANRPVGGLGAGYWAWKHERIRHAQPVFPMAGDAIVEYYSYPMPHQKCEVQRLLPHGLWDGTLKLGPGADDETAAPLLQLKRTD